MAAERYLAFGWVILPAAVSPERAAEWKSDALRLVAQKAPGVSFRDDAPGGPLDQGGLYRHAQIDGHAVMRALPSLYDWYLRECHEYVQVTMDGRAITSPWPRSSVNVKVFGPGDEQGWHYDTNPLTALLYLTATNNATGTRIRVPGCGDVPVIAQPGDLLLMDGRRLLHHVPPVPPGGQRVTVPLNYYLPGDCERPEGIDRLVYGDAE